MITLLWVNDHVNILGREIVSVKKKKLSIKEILDNFRRSKGMKV